MSGQGLYRSRKASGYPCLGINPTAVADMDLLNPVPLKVTVSPELITSGRRLVRESNAELSAAHRGGTHLYYEDLKCYFKYY